MTTVSKEMHTRRILQPYQSTRHISISVHMARSARPSNVRLTFPKLISLGQVNPPSKSLISPLNDKYPNNEKRFEVSALRGTLEVWWALIILTHATDFAEKQGLLQSIISVKRLTNGSIKVLTTFAHAKQFSLQLRWFCPMCSKMRYFLDSFLKSDIFLRPVGDYKSQHTEIRYFLTTYVSPLNLIGRGKKEESRGKRERGRGKREGGRD